MKRLVINAASNTSNYKLVYVRNPSGENFNAWILSNCNIDEKTLECKDEDGTKYTYVVFNDEYNLEDGVVRLDIVDGGEETLSSVTVDFSSQLAKALKEIHEI